MKRLRTLIKEYCKNNNYDFGEYQRTYFIDVGNYIYEIYEDNKIWHLIAHREINDYYIIGKASRDYTTHIYNIIEIIEGDKLWLT